MRARLGAWLGCALSVLGVLGVIALSATDHRHRAVMVLVAVLAGMGALRLWTPGRPWFASRGRLVDVSVYVILAAIIWYLAPYVSTMAVRGRPSFRDNARKSPQYGAMNEAADPHVGNVPHPGYPFNDPSRSCMLCLTHHP